MYFNSLIMRVITDNAHARENIFLTPLILKPVASLILSSPT